MFVIVGDNGRIATSPDGETWTIQFTGIEGSLNGITYGNGCFIAVGEDGVILSSADGVVWMLRTSGNSNSLNSVTYGNGTFVAVGTQGTVLTSTDGMAWTSRIPENYVWTYDWLDGVTYGNGTFVAVGGGVLNGNMSSIILTSPDGVTWSSQSYESSSWLTGITYGNGTFIAVGNGGTILQSGNVLGSGAITVTSPIKGETWSAGETKRIAWAYNGEIGPVRIALLKGGVFDRIIETRTSKGQGGWGYFDWTMPVDLSTGSDYKIRVRSLAYPEIKDLSARFTVSQ
jgi:hypothetical protein